MAQEQIKLHKDQTTIFDFTENTTESSVPDIDISSIQIKTKPPYHKDLFPNVVLVQLSKTNYLALIARDHNTYATEFYYKKKDGSFNVFIPTSLKQKILNIREATKQEIEQINFNVRSFMIEEQIMREAIGKYIDLVNLELAFVENDFDKIFKILASIK
jgi:hypothetical protein